MSGTVTHRPRGNDRRRRRRPRLMDRRSGFDRRRPQDQTPLAAAIEAPLLRLRDDPRLLAEVLVLVNLLSILDLLITLTVLRLGASELNPVMAFLIGVHPLAAGVFKVSAVGLATLGLWLLRRHRAALTTSLLLLATYGALVIYELAGLAHLS